MNRVKTPRNAAFLTSTTVLSTIFVASTFEWKHTSVVRQKSVRDERSWLSPREGRTSEASVRVLRQDYFQANAGKKSFASYIQSRNNKNFVCLGPTSVYAPLFMTTVYLLSDAYASRWQIRIAKSPERVQSTLYTCAAFLLALSRLFASDSQILKLVSFATLFAYSPIPISALIICHVAAYLN